MYEPPPQQNVFNWIWIKWIYGFWEYVKETGMSDYALEVARGNVNGVSHINKFGRNTDVDATVEDVWDGGGVWVAPTTARIHDIVSTSTSDDGDPAGVGARTLRIYGLTSWDSAEVSEDITLNGTTNVATTNSYVIIYRMKVLTKGATNVNVGVITATAQTDSTVTAQINIGEGQTQMAIMGVPSTQTAYMTNYWGNLDKATAAIVDLAIRVNPEPDTELTQFLVKHNAGVDSDATTYFQHFFQPYFKIEGPAIIKLDAAASTVNIDVSAGFDLFLVNN